MNTHHNTWRRLAMAAALCFCLLAAAPALRAQTAPPDAPVLVTPPEAAQTTGVTDPPLGIPTLTWAPVERATRYQVQVSVSSGFAATVVDATTENTSYTPLAALGSGTFYWRVRAAIGSTWGAYAEPFSFTVDWSGGGALQPALLSPEHEATRAAFGHADLSWSAVPGAATYRFEIATDPALTSIVYSVETAQTHHTPLVRLGNNIYYWRVTPIDYRDHAGAASPIWQFTFSWSAAPQLLAPEHAAELPFVPRFSWTAVEAAKEYRLRISTQENFSTFQQVVTRNTDHTPTTAFSNDQDYFWMVQAVDGQGVASPWSEIRHFRARWYFQPQLLSPANNSIIKLAYPFFSWAPVPGAEQYQIQIDDDNSFSSPIADAKIFNVTNYTQPRWTTASLDTDYIWRVRAIDAQGNFSPWSGVRAFRFSNTTTPDLIYPLPYYMPDTVNMPVNGDRSFGAPVFIWNTAHQIGAAGSPNFVEPADYYRLEVDDDPAFFSPNFTIETAGVAAAPTLENPFMDLQDGRLYYWRVSAFRNGQQIPQPDVQVTWTTRYNRANSPQQHADSAELAYPADGYEAVQLPPVLGWLPVAGAERYRVQIARNRDFHPVADEALAAHLNYVPWQGQLTAMPYGTYWWRVLAENSDGQPIGDWSVSRHFNLSVDLAIGNLTDFPPPQNLAADTTGRARVASSPEQGQGIYELGDLYVIVDRRASRNFTQYWVFAFTTGATIADTVTYALYLDTDHKADSGAPTDPLGNNAIMTESLLRPEHVVYVNLGGDFGIVADYYSWNGTGWDPVQNLPTDDVQFDPALQSVQILIPYASLGSLNDDWVGSLAVTVYSLDANTVRDSVPLQSGTLNNPVFVSNMLLPLYPIDTPMSNPIVHYDMPPLRWRMPAYGTDGYQVQVARDSQFTQIVETWESYETGVSQFFTLIPTTFQSQKVYADNESYYWRVRTRHEKYGSGSSYDYGPWSPAMRFKLDSHRVGNPQLSTGVDAFMTPTFTWERVEGAAGYTIQIDDDANFSNSLINQKTDATSYTPLDVSSALQPGVQYFWRVVMRRDSNIIGHWSETLSFTKTSLWPEPVAPLTGAILNGQPTLRWNAVLTPSVAPRLAAPAYRVQVANNPAFTQPRINLVTQATSLTPLAGQTLADGVWYWRVALVDASNRTGPYSPVQSFTKEYPQPVLLWPAQESQHAATPTLRWAPVAGAAYYTVEYADNSNYNGSTKVTTDLSAHTPVKRLNTTAYYWRVKMFDADRNPGPEIEGRFQLRKFVYLPAILRQ